MRTAFTALMIFSSCQIAAATGPLFNVALTHQTITIAPVFNPKGPNKIYNHAGIKIEAKGYTLGGCTHMNNGFCTFAVSTDAPVEISVSGPSGPVRMKVCLSASGATISCEYHQINMPGIIFITQDSYSGDLNGISGADALCNAEAYMAGSIIPAGRTFKALLLSPSRYPCSNPDNNSFGKCGGIFARDWPLAPATVYYQPNGIDAFNTVNEFGVFDGEKVLLQYPTGEPSVAQFWSGIQSVHSSLDQLHINAWAFDDMNPHADHARYAENLAYCSDWTSANSSINGSVGSAGRYQGNVLGPVQSNHWGNYYYFNDEGVNYLFNLFSSSAYYTCDGHASLVCVG